MLAKMSVSHRKVLVLKQRSGLDLAKVSHGSALAEDLIYDLKVVSFVQDIVTPSLHTFLAWFKDLPTINF